MSTYINTDVTKKPLTSLESNGHEQQGFFSLPVPFGNTPTAKHFTPDSRETPPWCDAAKRDVADANPQQHLPSCQQAKGHLASMLDDLDLDQKLFKSSLNP